MTAAERRSRQAERVCSGNMERRTRLMERGPGPRKSAMHRTSPHIFDVDEHAFQRKVLDASRERPVLVDFWAEWCAPCLSLAPHLERVIDDYAGAVVLAKVEVDENMRLAGHYRLRGFPTVILFFHGEELGRFSGSRASHWIRDWIEDHARPLLDSGVQLPNRPG